MIFTLALKGIILGFAIAAPVGPIGVLCIKKTLQYGRLAGLASGLGAALADSVYGLIAAFGLSFLAHILSAGQFWLRLVGGAFLVYLGIKIFLTLPSSSSQSPSHKTLFQDFISTFFLTLTNPMTIFSYIAIFAGLGLGAAKIDPLQAIWLVFGVFIGSALWWLLLSEGVTLFRKKVSQRAMLWINRFAGILLFGFGIAAWLSMI